jgi:putative PEP-CTERM system histidine kinase
LFSYRYDYRREWLRFTRALGANEPGESLYQQVIRAMADLVESQGGTLWLKSYGAFAEVGSINCARAVESEPAHGELAAFLAKTGWVIRVDECVESPASYAGLTLPAWLLGSEAAWLLIPLASGGDLVGFVVLSRSRAPVEVNWEVRDLLKTAGRQAAISIAQIRATEALVESEKLDSFNRMSAFVVHDLKNLVAQLGLVLKNAARHQDNPDFRKDMFETVGHAVDRMNQLMLQLHSGTTPVEKVHTIGLSTVVQRVINAKRSKDVTIQANLAGELWVLAHAERIERVIGHIVQNAIDASDSVGATVTVSVAADKQFATIEIADTGVGMAEEFVQNRLFHPFQTTKPQGMGIGMYESYHYVHGIGGRIDVKSAPGAGTQLRIYLPLATGDALSTESSRPAV